MYPTVLIFHFVFESSSESLRSFTLINPSRCKKQFTLSAPARNEYRKLFPRPQRTRPKRLVNLIHPRKHVKKKKTRNQAYQTHKNQVTINLCQPSSRSVAQRTVSTKDIKLGISQLYQIFHYRNHPVLQPRCRDTAKRLTRGEPDNIFRA